MMQQVGNLETYGQTATSLPDFFMAAAYLNVSL